MRRLISRAKSKSGVGAIGVVLTCVEKEEDEVEGLCRSGGGREERKKVEIGLWKMRFGIGIGLCGKRVLVGNAEGVVVM